MDSHVHKINRDLIIGWLIIVGILFVSYLGEVLKGERTLLYLFIYMLVTAIPALICLVLYLRAPKMLYLRYYIVIGYFLMYIFSMMTGSTSMVFSYILPMLSFLVLYHQPKLILYTGIASMIVNFISVGIKFYDGTMTLANSKDAEIQLALLFLCFGGSYVATRLYDEITNENTAHLNMLDEKNNQIQKMTLQTIATIANMIDARDEYTQGHSKRVSEYSAAIAEKLGLPDEEIQNIRFVALLHDIGKIGVPDSVLNKPGKLTDEEYHLMKRHTITGSEILKDIDMIPGIDIGAKYHHERYDGRGYPEGLKENEIPFIARIISVADSYDARTGNRIYRRHLTEEKVLQELIDGNGTQFDPEVCDAMIHLLQEGKLEHISKQAGEEKEITDATLILSRVIEKNEEKALENMRYDELTGVFSRRVGDQLISEAMESYDGCLMLFDLDHFRYINITTGFVRGDFFLRETVDCIRQMREDVLISRYGEDKFSAFFKNAASKEEVSRLARRFYEKVGEKIQGNPELKDLSASIGIVIERKGKDDYSLIIKQAKKALYIAKQQGGGTFHLHSEPALTTDKNHSGADLERLLTRINGDDTPGQKYYTYPEIEQCYEIIQNLIKQYNYRVSVLLFTLITKDGKTVSVEERDRVMGFLEQSVTQSARHDDIMAKYSSSQRILVLPDISENECHTMVDKILKGFYKMYENKELIVHYDMTDLSRLQKEDL